MNIETLKQELQKIGAKLQGSGTEYGLRHLSIVHENGKWIVYVPKVTRGNGNSLVTERLEVKEHAKESEACADFLAREKKYQVTQLEQHKNRFESDIIELTVISGAVGFGGSPIAGDWWSWSMPIVAWCGKDGTVHQGDAKLVRAMTDKEKATVEKQIMVDDIYKIKARVEKKRDADKSDPRVALLFKNAPPTTRFYLEEVVGKSNHPKLLKILEKRLQPISIKDEQLGVLEWSRQFKTFEFNLPVWSGEWKFGIRIEGVDELKKHLPEIRRHIAWMQKNKAKFVNEIVNPESVKLANEWRPCESGGKPYYVKGGKRIEGEITSEIFANSLKDCSIGMRVNGEKYDFSMYFKTSDPDLFAGHSIEVQVTADKDDIGDKYFIKVHGLAG